MTISIELWQLGSLAVVLGGVFTGLGKLLLAQFQRHIDKRLAVLSVDSASWRVLERDFLSLKAELPEKYVRREDYLRGQTVIEAKLDAISSELKLVQIQGANRAN